jgi:hypothetical protein
MTDTSPEPEGHRYDIGDCVRVLPERVGGNPRTPPYVRGKRGTVVELHGLVPNPFDHRGVYPPLCTVQFEFEELTGRPSRDRLTADIHEDWLEDCP